MAAAEPGSVDSSIHEAFMQSAAMSALAGVRLKHGGPFGASIVRDGIIVACAHNMVLHRNDPCCHAEMNAISQACRALGTHDLSDCDLYTTCEPCPMCWGAVQWSRLNKAYLGVDRHTAAKYGFDDKVFYDEIDDHAGGTYGVMKVTAGQERADAGDGVDFRLVEEVTREEAPAVAGVKPSIVLQRHATPTTTGDTGARKAMVLVFDGILQDRCLELFSDPKHNKTYKRRFGGAMGSKVKDLHEEVFKEPVQSDGSPRASKAPPSGADYPDLAVHEGFMQRAIEVARRGVRDGLNKEHEPFGCVIVKGGEVLAEACNTVTKDRDATATAEVNAIRQATQRLGAYSLEGCDIYTTAHPDLMSLGAILWSRISNVYCGVSQQIAAQFGFEEGLMHLSDLLDTTSGKRVTETIENVAKAECEAVFQEWQKRNGTIY